MGIQGVEPRLSGYEPLVLTVIRYTRKAHRQGIEPQPSDLQSGALPLRYRWIILPWVIRTPDLRVPGAPFYQLN